MTRTGTDQMVVTVKAGQGTIQSIKFGTAAQPMQNAVVDTIGPVQTITGFGEQTPPAGVVQQAFVIRRLQANQPVMVHLEIQDGCGSWKTFVGTGANGF